MIAVSSPLGPQTSGSPPNATERVLLELLAMICPRIVLAFLCVASLPLVAIVGCKEDTGPSPIGAAADDAASEGATPDGPARDGTTAGDAGPDAPPADAGGLFERTGGTFTAVGVNGIIDGTAFFSDSKGDPGVQSRLVVVLSDRTGLCSASVLHENATVISIDMLSGDKPFKPGTFTQHMKSVPGQVDVGVSKLGPTCKGAGQDYGASIANVVVTQVTPTVAGTFDMTFPGDAGTMQGTFNVPICGQAFGNACLP